MGFSITGVATVSDVRDGMDGMNGINGVNGQSITLVSTVDMGTFTRLTFSDGSVVDVPNGEDGAPGMNGTNGTNGTNGNDGAPGARYAERTLYTNPAVTTAPTSGPTAVITWGDGTLSSITTGWSETPPTVAATASAEIWTSIVQFVDLTGIATTSTRISATAPSRGTTFDGLVTFANGNLGAVGGGFTTINGNQITTGTITATQISTDYIYAGNISADNINAGTLNVERLPGLTLQETVDRDHDRRDRGTTLTVSIANVAASSHVLVVLGLAGAHSGNSGSSSVTAEGGLGSGTLISETMSLNTGGQSAATDSMGRTYIGAGLTTSAGTLTVTVTLGSFTGGTLFYSGSMGVIVTQR